ncbi:hypothetical protein ES705_37447 [subsurface metagenome]
MLSISQVFTGSTFKRVPCIRSPLNARGLNASIFSACTISNFFPVESVSSKTGGNSSSFFFFRENMLLILSQILLFFFLSNRSSFSFSKYAFNFHLYSRMGIKFNPCLMNLSKLSVFFILLTNNKLTSNSFCLNLRSISKNRGCPKFGLINNVFSGLILSASINF